MSDVIKLLPDSVANQIAAGEVIQRPASVIKELVENAVDAGADEIKIILKDAGRTLIQVVDNGSGMSATDARLAFERHSTSKITQAADLFALHTMGFRGEALASIAAVAQVELRTMRRGDSIGARLLISGSKVEEQEPDVCPEGTSMAVKNLFFNVPARRKFLKKDSVELSNIMHEFERLALVNTGVEFSVSHNGVLLHRLMRGNLKQRIVALFGKSLDSQLIPIATDTEIVKINGFIGRPEHARRRGALQFMFVNGRNMRHPYFHKAVAQCYEQLIAPEEQPNYFIDFSVNPDTIDVNIHPTKNEIKFEHEQPIWQLLTAAIKEALGKFNAVPSIDFDTADAPDIPVFDPKSTSVKQPPISADRFYNPFRQPMQDWEKLYEDFRREKEIALTTPPSPAESRLNAEPPSDAESEADLGFIVRDEEMPVLEIGGRYIFTPADRGVRIIDRHRAHVAVLYARYMAMADGGASATQRLIFPEELVLEPSQQPVLEELAPEMERLGFDLSPLGGGSWAINGIPASVDKLNPTELVKSIINEAMEQTAVDAGESLRERTALAMARSSAIRQGQSLTDMEMRALVNDLFALDMPGFTPDGLATFTRMDASDIAKLLS